MGLSTLEEFRKGGFCLVDSAGVEIWGFGKEEHHKVGPLSSRHDCQRSSVGMACSHWVLQLE